MIKYSLTIFILTAAVFCLYGADSVSVLGDVPADDRTILQFADAHHILLYVLLFLGMFVEGEMMLILAGVLVKHKCIHFFDTIMIAFVAVMLHDIGYWLIGKGLAKIKREKVLGVNLKKVVKLFAQVKEREGLYIFTSKFAWGINRFVLISSGYFQTRLKTLVKYSSATALIWTTTLVSLGYMFAEQTAILKKDVRIIVIGFAALFILIFCVEYFVKKVFVAEASSPEDVTEED